MMQEFVAFRKSKVLEDPSLMLHVLGSVGLLAVAENAALYNMQHARKYGENRSTYFILAALIYALAVPVLLYRALAWEDVGMVNFVWNIFSTLSGFAIGYYFFNENINKLQKIGVGVSLLGLGLLILGKTTESPPQ